MACESEARASNRLLLYCAVRENKQNWQRVLYMRDRDGSDRHLFVPEQLFWQNPNRVAGTLINVGFDLGTGYAEQLVRGLMQTSVEKRLVVVARPGWHRGHYVKPDGTIGPRSSRIPVLAGSVGTAPTVSADRIELWQRTVGRYSEGNSRLVAAVSIALGGIAIGLFDTQLGIGLHLRGLASLGKTTALRVAASVFGPAHKEVRSWSATDSGLETLAVRHHHRCLIIDELAQIRPDAAAQAAYLLANGAGRQRAQGSGRARPAEHWKLTFLSSGEISLEEKVAERSGAPQMREGQAVRLIDLPADVGCGHGIYEDLHGFADGAALSDALNQATEQSMGDIADEFAGAIANDVEKARAFLRTEQERFVRSSLPDEADGIVRRVYANLGFLAAATELATRKGILPWRPGGGHAGIGVCAHAWFSAWRLRSGMNRPHALAQAWLAENIARLTPWELAARDVDEPGYYCHARNVVHLKAAGWRDLCGDLSSAYMQAALKEAGVFSTRPLVHPAASQGNFTSLMLLLWVIEAAKVTIVTGLDRRPVCAGISRRCYQCYPLLVTPRQEGGRWRAVRYWVCAERSGLTADEEFCDRKWCKQHLQASRALPNFATILSPGRHSVLKARLLCSFAS